VEAEPDLVDGEPESEAVADAPDEPVAAEPVEAVADAPDESATAGGAAATDEAATAEGAPDFDPAPNGRRSDEVPAPDPLPSQPERGA
jgi:hypothetical protein